MRNQKVLWECECGGQGTSPSFRLRHRKKDHKVDRKRNKDGEIVLPDENYMVK